jgi:hypothetical protein
MPFEQRDLNSSALIFKQTKEELKLSNHEKRIKHLESEIEILKLLVEKLEKNSHVI